MKTAIISHTTVAMLFLLSPLISYAQSNATTPKTIADIEYSPGGTYGSALGLGLYKLDPIGIGFYGNLLTSINAKREPQYDALTVTSFGDPVTDRFKDKLLMINLGITKSFTANIGGYIGIGYASADGRAQKFDPLRILASDGTYYVNDPANDKSGANLNGGVILGFEKVSLNVGYNSFTARPYVGLGVRF